MAPGIRVDYIYSACVVISTPDVRILCDPWFTQGIYDGSWYHYPKVERPLERIGPCDAIYVSHIHPDHYDPAFIKEYFRAFGEKPIYIADHRVNHLRGKMRGDKLRGEVLQQPRRFGATEIEIVPHAPGSVSDIDSALIVRYTEGDRHHCVVNVNDIVFDGAITEKIRRRCPDIDILLLGYTGAGPYPQTYFDQQDPMLYKEAASKKEAFFDRYRNAVAGLDPKVTIPFAGQYVLGGKLAHLNSMRGVADATEVLAFDARAVVLADDGASISTADYRPSKIRPTAYDLTEGETYLRSIADRLFDYERLINADEAHQLPVQRLLGAAYANAKAKSEVEEDYFFTFRLSHDEVAVLNANKNATEGLRIMTQAQARLLSPRSEIQIDTRYFFGLLTHVYHWNNAEVGSQFFTRRYPATYFNREAQSFLNFLTV